MIIPRNHIIENIIKESYKENYSKLFTFNEILKFPYVENKNNEKYRKLPQDHEKVFQTYFGT